MTRLCLTRDAESKVASGAARGLLLAAGLLAAGLLLHVAPRQFDAGLINRFVADHGARGGAIFVLAAGLACAVGLPRQVAAFAGGYAFGAAGGTALSLAAQMLGCAAAFAWARALGQGWVARRLPARMRRIEQAVLARPFTATLTLRLLPVGSNLLLNLAAGLSGVATAPFLAGSCLGYLPQTIVFALLGGGAQLARGTQIAVGVALFAASGLLGATLLRRTAPRGV